MTNRFDIVPVGVKHEGRVIIRVIMRPRPRRSVVLAAGRERCPKEGIDGGAVFGRNRNMKRAIQSAFTADPKIRLDPVSGSKSDRRPTGTLPWAPFFIRQATRAYNCRSTIFFLICAIAFAGLSPLGQACEQFMMVWQR
jgi:hypothetical protein